MGIGYAHRYSSWDLCYKHFRRFFLKEKISKSNIRAAGLNLGFYLASWGMLRNSELLNYGIKKYEELAKKLHDIYWVSKKEGYDENKKFIHQYEQIQLILKNWKCENIKKSTEIKISLEKIEEDLSICELLKVINANNVSHDELISRSNEVRKYLKALKKNPKYCEKVEKNKITKLQKKLNTTPSITLITKIMLGVYANTPAIDSLFKESAEKFTINFGSTNTAKTVLYKINKILKKEIVNDKEIHHFIKSFDSYKGLSEAKKLDAIFFERAQLNKNL